ncbi:hypothetical protein [Nonomuraea sp. NPDC003201]
MRTRFTTTFAAALLVVSGTAATGAQASAGDQPQDKPAVVQPVTIAAEPPPGFSSWDEVLRVQGKLDATAERLKAAGGVLDGFGKITEAVEERRVRLYWKGDPPAEIRSIVSGSDSTVDVVPARYSARELDRESERLRRLSSGTEGFRIVQINQSPQDGLRIGVTGSTDAAAASSVVREAGVPVTVTEGRQAEPLSRIADTIPYWGGSAITIGRPGLPSVSGYCSTGFGIRDLNTGDRFLLTADHCRQSGEIVLVGKLDAGATGTKMGTVSGGDPDNDSLKIRTSTDGVIYNNNATTEFSNPVIGSKYPFEGQFLCTSGAFTGTRCNAKVGEVDIEFGRPDGGWRYPMAQLDSVNGTILAGQGDSGGPVFQVNPQNHRQVFAVGLISMARAGDTGSRCETSGGGNPSTPPLPNSRCFAHIWFTYVQEMEDAYDAAVLTSNAP